MLQLWFSDFMLWEIIILKNNDGTVLSHTPSWEKDKFVYILLAKLQHHKKKNEKLVKRFAALAETQMYKS